ncbi:ribonuclease H [Emticicia sp. CRIBPO]|uniref:ribonuclease H1 domain-containing protein n=1 Tax=Emticicia sp. CRIBPO TaxID=2683258 RepID=UPI001412B3A8|nr:ribonuclease H family protein [Emticicia sp. CRIBPO]NBA86163.1 ribonuclease H [Emticicia sp. CRIBPO]
MAKKQKYYAVWEGREQGVFDTWEKCKKQIDGFEGAKYKSFETEKEAHEALSKNYYAVVAKKEKSVSIFKGKVPPPIKESIVVDAAWNTASGDMEYQGFDYKTGNLLFRKGPFQDGTNNIGEFLAVVHALALLKKHKSDLPVYSDSKTAISWVSRKKANTKLDPTPRNKELFELIDRAESWLKTNTYTNKILKWETEHWGENPADFGRK